LDAGVTTLALRPTAAGRGVEEHRHLKANIVITYTPTGRIDITKAAADVLTGR
jgi:hypothetical protein